MLQEVIEDNRSYSKLEKQKRLLSLLREKKVRIGSSDLYFFCKYILGYRDMEEEPHRELCRVLQSPSKRKLVILPRGSFKSSVATVGRNILKIIRDPNIRIIIDSEDVTNARKFLGEIKLHFENNDELIKLFGNYVGPKWAADEITVAQRTIIKREPTVMTSGVETPRVGMHCDLLVEDDLHSQHNTSTPEHLEKVINHWKLNQSILDPGGEEVVIATPWNLGDLSYTIREQEKGIRIAGGRKFHIHWRGCYNKDGSLFFPTRLTHEFLRDKLIEQGSSVFSAQYKCDALDESRLVFKQSWIKFYGHYPPQNLNKTTTLDPAISEKDDACDSAFITVGTDPDGFMYILRAEAFKDNPARILDAAFRIQREDMPIDFGVEVVAFQKALKFWAWERSIQTGEYINFKELKTDTKITKEMRIKALVPFLESGLLLFPGNGPESLTGDMFRLYEQIIQFPVGKKNDLLDALAYQLQLRIPAKLKRVAEPKSETQDLIKAAYKLLPKKHTGTLPTIGGWTRRNVTDSVLVGARG